MIVNMHDAKTNLSKLVEKVEAGEDVIIARAGVPLVRLVRIEKKAIPWGALEGKIRMAEDFDDPLPDDIARAFGMID